jgi:hypothetical protein
MTSRESTPRSRNSRATSLAKDTLVAWKALQAYLSASAVRTSTTRTGWSRKPNTSVTAWAAPGSEVPTTRKGDEKKSAIPEPSRRNSGHIAAPIVICVPARPSVSAGVTMFSTVPGGTVLRMTTVCRPDDGGVTTRSAATRSSTARRTWDRSVAPRASEGVPTHTSDTSARSRASAHEVVACNLPSATARETSASRPGSVTGLRPERISSTLAASTSTPQTWCPREARQAAVTVPT